MRTSRTINALNMIHAILAQIIHPDTVDFNLENEAEDFYQEFYNMPFEDGHQRFSEMFRALGCGDFSIIDDGTGFWISLRKPQ